MLRRLPIAIALATLAALGGCPADQPAPPRTGCGGDDPRIGRTATLVTRFHGVSGSARIIDNCTIRLENFSYDGQGLDVRVYGGDAAGDFAAGVVLTGDIRRAGGYTNETLEVTLPEGVTLDDVQSVSIWCVPIAMSFGDGVFE